LRIWLRMLAAASLLSLVAALAAKGLTDGFAFLSSSP
jgi:hypothetical protein